MCGRFVSASPPDEIAAYFEASLADEQLVEPSYNVAPTDDVAVVRQRSEHPRELDGQSASMAHVVVQTRL